MAHQLTYTQEEVDFVGANHKDMTAKEMAEYLVRERQTIYNILHKNKWKPKDGREYPVREHESKQPPEIINARSLKKKRQESARPPAQYTNAGYGSLSASLARIEHELKTWPVFFEAILRGDKTFEARKDDRDYQVGDTLVLREWEPTTGEFTGRVARRNISFLLAGGQFGVEKGHCVMGLQKEHPVVEETKAITLLQPWASLVAAGLKTYLTRTTGTSYRGRVLIHAAARKTPAYIPLPDFVSAWIIQGGDITTTGAIIGEVTVVDCLPADRVLDTLTERERALGAFTHDRFAWKLTDAVLYEKPRFCKGAVGLWEVIN